MNGKHRAVFALAPGPRTALGELVIIDQANALRKIQRVLCEVVTVAQRTSPGAIEDDMVSEWPIDLQTAQRPLLGQEQAVSIAKKVPLRIAWIIAALGELVRLVDRGRKRQVQNNHAAMPAVTRSSHSVFTTE